MSTDQVIDIVNQIIAELFKPVESRDEKLINRLQDAVEAFVRPLSESQRLGVYPQPEKMMRAVLVRACQSVKDDGTGLPLVTWLTILYFKNFLSWINF